ncbi:MAG TPA: hypothetical protein VER08_01220 [Pyrinomonadaceae bacterium]|nr:hypothetical protein [Pyrinomonadaceae bacterium]
MSDTPSQTVPPSPGRPRARGAGQLALALVVALGLASAALLTRWMDARRPAPSLAAASEDLYLKPETLRRLSMSFNGLAADWYWMRTLQYVGRKVLAHGRPVELDDLSPVGLRALEPLLDATTTLDPQFMAAYEYGAVVLPSVDREAAVRVVTKGIEANPREWRLHHHLGYIHWQGGQFREAARAYSAGAQLPGAPRWMRAMAARIEAEGGDRSLAREMFARMRDEAEEESIRLMAAKRLAQLQSFDERDAIRKAITFYRERAGRCPESWAALAPLLRRVPGLRLDRAGAPLDPADTPYRLVAEGCDVDLDENSEVPYK